MHTSGWSARAGDDPNEDAAGVLGRVAVVLDGAGVPARFRAGCHHSVAWYSHALAARLLRHAQDDGLPLSAVLARGIAEVRDLHAHECALERGGPSATVVMVRVGGEELEHLVLCDSSLLLERRGGRVERLTDERIEQVVRVERTAEAIEARRNAPGGFWVARHEPEAAQQAVTGSTPLAALRAVHLVSDGVTRAIDLLALHDAGSLARALREDPEGVLRDLRRAERRLPEEGRPRKVHDDATVLTLLPELWGEQGAGPGGAER
ncbi:protein phosphatase 2C domain-containing protein [Brachybacterium saurashtrense]|uniref:PPM-type phosphatase domain-containing protein n=1 Tax=Brachybacterium saurashtrense TaxID=556288 RepID=A0A345YSL3_9MICO|nr:protein phosphatase 2C domain-containing protein [Brachybacterium saurashtrense]AXK46915.1 hypothetical protein DWV08_15685 [Brachybacterium saurashtrense]RRR22630.1 hypothetical protein DXU92_10305 [Brachybacterium saurashtrense]